MARIFRKSLQSKASSSQNLAPLTLMSTNLDRMVDGLQYLQEAIVAVPQLGIALWLLERQVGLGAVGPVAVGRRESRFVNVSDLTIVLCRSYSVRRPDSRIVLTSLLTTPSGCRRDRGVRTCHGKRSVPKRRIHHAGSVDSFQRRQHGSTQLKQESSLPLGY